MPQRDRPYHPARPLPRRAAHRQRRHGERLGGARRAARPPRRRQGARRAPRRGRPRAPPLPREARTAAGLSSHPQRGDDLRRRRARRQVVHRHGAACPAAPSPTGCAPASEIPHDVALRWLREAGSALDAAHDAGHRPPRRQAGEHAARRARAGSRSPTSASRGSALEDQITQTGQVLGTAAYISPEQAMGEPATAASDRYALAVVAFELLTGSRPFAARELRRPGARPRRGRAAARVRARRPTLPPAVDRVLARGMAKEPEERWEQRRRDGRALDDALAAPPRAAAPPPLPPDGDATRVMGAARAPPARARPRRRRVRRARAAACAPVRLVAASQRCCWSPPAPIALADGGGDEPERDRRAAGADPRPRRRDGDGDRRRRPRRRPTPRRPPSRPRRPTRSRATARRTGTEQKPSAAGDDPAALQLQAFNLNNAGEPDAGARRTPQQAVELCKGSDAVSPCAYALFEYARALRTDRRPGRARSPCSRSASSASRTTSRARSSASWRSRARPRRRG